MRTTHFPRFSVPLWGAALLLFGPAGWQATGMGQTRGVPNPSPPAGTVERAEQQEPPALNPFGPRKREPPDAEPGYVELSDGTVLAGKIYLTRDVKLQVFDESLGRQREIPLRVVDRVDCDVEKEWLEREWRFKENANNEKVYTGRRYPARQYVHTITLRDGRKIAGPLSGILYVRGGDRQPAVRLLMHKRQKGPVGSSLDELVYLRRVRLGAEALNEGRRRSEPEAPRGGPR